MTIAQSQAHDHISGAKPPNPPERAETAANMKSFPWSPNLPPCNYIVNTPYSSVTPRYVAFYEWDSATTAPGPDGKKSAGDMTIGVYGDHSPLNPEGGKNGFAPACDDPRAAAQQMVFQHCVNSNDPEQCRTVHSACAQNLENTYAIGDLSTGNYVHRMSWNYKEQGDNTFFYSCLDFELRDDSQKLGTAQALLNLIWSQLYWLAPVGLLPVVAAAIYARRHKRESMRLSRMSQMSGVGDARMTMMSGVTAKTAAKYQSGFTDNMSAGTGFSGGRMTMMSGATAEPAAKYQSGFTSLSAGSEGSQ